MPRPQPVRLGVVGAGLVAQVAHLPILRERDDLFALAALAEPDEAVRRRVAARYAIPRTAAGHRELLGDGGLDAVLIASPNGAHAEQVLDALDAGLHVLVEKPMCLSPADAERIVAARDRTGLVVEVGYMKRYDPAVGALLERLGRAEVVHVESITHDPGLRDYFAPDRHGARRRADDPRRDAARAAAGSLADATLAQAREAVGVTDHRRAAWWSDVFLGALVHDVNLVRALLDRAGIAPVRVADAFAGDDRAGGTIVLSNGARWTTAWLAAPSVADFAERITVHTTEGIHRLEFPAPYLRHAPTVYTHARGHERRTFRSWDESYERSLEHFRASLAGEAACATPPEQAVADIDLLAELFRTSAPAASDTPSPGAAPPRTISTGRSEAAA